MKGKRGEKSDLCGFINHKPETTCLSYILPMLDTAKIELSSLPSQ